jgi:FkbM family methyltransferase
MKRIAKQLKETTKEIISISQMLVYGLSRKLMFILTGKYCISETCQIKDLDKIYQQVGILTTDGTFVEVGGFDGERFSNSSFLADKGWKGVYVEPIPCYSRLIKARHLLNSVIVEKCAVSEKEGVQKLYKMSAFSTLSKENLEAYQEMDWSKQFSQNPELIDVKTKTLQKILEDNLISLDFELLIVDVEGFEEVIIQAMIQSPWRPQNVLIELEDNHPSISAFKSIKVSHQRVRKLLEDEHYQIIYQDPINSFYTKS